MTPEQLRAKFPHASASFITANFPDHAKGVPDALGRLAGVERKQDQKHTLELRPSAQPRRRGSVAVICQIISLRNRVLDADNSAAGGNKALQDSISQSLCLDDRSETIRFEYAQCHTSGPEGTIVRIAWV